MREARRQPNRDQHLRPLGRVEAALQAEGEAAQGDETASERFVEGVTDVEVLGKDGGAGRRGAGGAGRLGWVWFGSVCAGGSGKGDGRNAVPPLAIAE